MMEYCKTNKLDITINYNQLLLDYSIIKFSTSEKYIKYGALILDELGLNLKAKSINFESGRSFYAMFDKTYIQSINISKKLENIKDGEKLSFDFLNEREIKRVPVHILAQLVINSISTPEHKRLTFNNITGKLYVLNRIDNLNDKKQIFKIVGLEFHINTNCCLQLNVKTFSSVLLKKKIDFSKKKFSSYPRYTFVNSTGTLRRVLSTEKVEAENEFILRQPFKNGVLEKNNIPFLDFSNLNEFNNSKIGIVTNIIKVISENLSNYLNIDFNEVKINQVIRHSNVFDFNSFSANIYLCDAIKNEDSSEHLENISEEVQKFVKNSEVKISKKINKNGYNIKLIHNKSYYEKYNQPDPYKPSDNIQHVTVEDFKTEPKACIKAIIKELAIKNDIKHNKVSAINWLGFNYKNKWIFSIKDKDAFYFLTINPSGTTVYEKYNRSLFNYNEYDELCSLYDDENIEYIVQDDNGNINIVKQTDRFTIPEYAIIRDTLYKEDGKIIISKTNVLNIVNNLFEKEKIKDYTARIEQIENWNKKNLLNCFENKNDKKIFVKKVQEETGEVLKSYLRDMSRYEILDSNLDIHSFKENDKNYYFVGTKGKGIQQKIPRASVIREIESYKNSEYIFDKILPLMNVDFVRNGDLTVLPFPIKYLREWKRIRHKNI